MSHSKLSPSSASRWLACPSSLDHPAESEVSSSYADEGTAAHELASRCLLIGVDPEMFQGQTIGGYEVTDEMVTAVSYFVELARCKAQGAQQIFIEARHVLPDLPDFGGTVDFLAYHIKPDGGVHLVIVDLKYGQGVPVEAEENLQLGCYAIINGLALAGDIVSADFIIVQPRLDHPLGVIRSWTASAEWLSDLFQEVLEVYHGRRTGYKAGDHCRWCPAKPHCPELHQLTTETARTEFSAEDLSPEKAAYMLDRADAIRKFLEAVEQWAHGRMEKGVPIPGYKLVQKRGLRKWAHDQEELLKKLRKIGVKKADAFEARLLSPAQMEKLTSWGESPADRKKAVQPLTVIESSGTTVAPESDRRKAITFQTASDEFANVENSHDPE